LAEQKATTSVLYEETRIFEPPRDLVENSNVMQWMKKKGFKSEREDSARLEAEIRTNLKGLGYEI